MKSQTLFVGKTFSDYIIQSRDLNLKLPGIIYRPDLGICYWINPHFQMANKNIVATVNTSSSIIPSHQYQDQRKDQQ